MIYSHVIVGGGSAGCVLASRLSEDSRNNVVLVEAGADYVPSATPLEILDTYAGRALGSPQFFWDDFKIQRGGAPLLSKDESEKNLRYEQPRVIGGGSSINGQVALRGIPDDYRRWSDLGAKGWDWDGVLPYFRRMERDLDFCNQLHGAEGPIKIRRFFPEKWDNFTRAVVGEWEKEGYRYGEDMNGQFEDGYYPIPVSNDGIRRSSTALDYLTDEVRRRPNLSILSQHVVKRIVFQGRQATGVIAETAAGERRIIGGKIIILSAGAFSSPYILMKSGVGLADHLRERGIEVLLDRPGVGANLQDHPMITISAFLPPKARNKTAADRRNFAYLRYSSGLDGCRESDMIMMAVCRSSWHAIGQRIGTLSANLGYAYSRGSVRISEYEAERRMDVKFNWLQDDRDLKRMADAFRKMASMLATPQVAEYATNAFPSSYSARVRIIQENTFRNATLTRIGASLMDVVSPLRGILIDAFIREAPPLKSLMADEQMLAEHLCRSIGSTYHPCGTCRMGDPLDAGTVVDRFGAVIGLSNLYVADASIMPEITRTNTNIPTIMIAEKISDMLRSDR